jgi:hypothetical protein
MPDDETEADTSDESEMSSSKKTENYLEEKT